MFIFLTTMSKVFLQSRADAAGLKVEWHRLCSTLSSHSLAFCRQGPDLRSYRLFSTRHIGGGISITIFINLQAVQHLRANRFVKEHLWKSGNHTRGMYCAQAVQHLRMQKSLHMLTSSLRSTPCINVHCRGGRVERNTVNHIYNSPKGILDARSDRSRWAIRSLRTGL